MDYVNIPDDVLSYPTDTIPYPTMAVECHPQPNYLERIQHVIIMDLAELKTRFDIFQSNYTETTSIMTPYTTAGFLQLLTTYSRVVINQWFDTVMVRDDLQIMHLAVDASVTCKLRHSTEIHLQNFIVDKMEIRDRFLYLIADYSQVHCLGD